MTNLEAADELQYAINLIKQDGKDWLDERDIPVLEMAISALQAQDVPSTNDGDMTSRQAAIEAAIKATDDWDGGYNITRANMIEKELNDLPSAQPEQRWIPCRDRLPESKAAYYIVTLERRDRICLPNDIAIARWDYDRRKGNDSWHWCKERKVIAWMSLPEPYQKEGEKQ